VQGAANRRVVHYSDWRPTILELVEEEVDVRIRAFTVRDLTLLNRAREFR